jgi:hypothetical protein
MFVISMSEAYKRAEAGDAVLLASALAHEQFHVEHGPEEGPAYEEQLRVLRKLDAPASDIAAIERVKAKIAAQDACGEGASSIRTGRSSGRAHG